LIEIYDCLEGEKIESNRKRPRVKASTEQLVESLDMLVLVAQRYECYGTWTGTWIICMFLLYELAYSCPALTLSRSARSLIYRTTCNYAHLPLCPCLHICLSHILHQLLFRFGEHGSIRDGLAESFCWVRLESANCRLAPPSRCLVPCPSLRLLRPSSCWSVRSAIQVGGRRQRQDTILNLPY